MEIKANIGDKLKIKTKKEVYEGTLMPRNELADDAHIVIKLKSGYNIGILKTDIIKAEKLSSEKEKPTKSKLDFDKSKPKVSIVSTGGTITSRVSYKTGGVYPSTKPSEVLINIPELKDFVNIKKISSPFRLLSGDMTPKEWPAIAKEVYKELNSDSRGIIVTHGTDTLHYTAAALSFMIKNLNKPIALVGAQRSVDRGSFDGALNLICGAHYCLSDIAEVAIVMHATMEDEYCIASRGTKVRKMHSSRRDAFRPINKMPLTKIWPDGNTLITDTDHNMRSEGKAELDAKFDENVALIQAYPGADPNIVDFYVKKGCKGIIIAGTGFGHVPTQPLNKKFNWIPAIKKAIEKGIFIGATTQTIYGRTDPYVYSYGRLMLDAGVTFLKDMLPETAYVKLGWVLGHTKKMEEVKKMMLTNYAGEIQEKIDPRSFLY